MKSKFLLIAMLAVITLISCKKDDDPTPNTETETTIEMSRDQATTDFLVDDANNVMDEAISDEDLMGGRPYNVNTSASNLSCATITVTPLSGFPKTIVIDFGTGCTSPNNITRSGKIIVVLSDSLRRPGSTSVMTFDNYYVQGFKKEGTITWTNTTVPPQRSWQRKVENGKITAPGGRFWLHNSLKDVVQTEGNATPRILIDDIFSITGNSTVTNANNVSRTSTIITPLRKKVACRHIDTGTVRTQGPNHTALLDYGNGVCDNIATISIDGGAPRTIQLP